VAEIAAVDIAASWAAWHEIGSEPAKWDPRTRETADHSLPYIFARVLVDGAITVASFAPAAVTDPTLRPLMAKISVRQDDGITALFPERVVMRVVATSAGGTERRIETADPRGHPRNPMSDAETGDKFRRLAAPVLGQRKAEAALAMLWAIEREADLAALYGLLDREA
jgi:2-methylcitrate dehydratase